MKTLRIMKILKFNIIIINNILGSLIENYNIKFSNDPISEFGLCVSNSQRIINKYFMCMIKPMNNNIMAHKSLLH